MTDQNINDLTIQAATVNGSGSQTANLILTRAIFHMGIPVAPKNVFPSNIEGLPTWYQLRVTPQGHMARRTSPPGTRTCAPCGREASWCTRKPSQQRTLAPT